MRPLDAPSNFDFTPYTLPIYESVLVRFKAADLDQEVKERAISCMGFIVSHLGDSLAGRNAFRSFKSFPTVCFLMLHRSADGLSSHLLGSSSQ